jgi:hypothetical protein
LVLSTLISQELSDDAYLAPSYTVMGNPKASSVAPLPPAESLGVPPAVEQTVEQPRDFHFAVTWVTLFAHLDLVESTGPWRKPEAPAALALIPVVPAPLAKAPPAYQESGTAWEMVVPKMIRTGRGEFTPADEKGIRS